MTFLSRFPNKLKHTGSALILVLWAVMVMAAVLISFVSVVENGVEETGRIDALQRCRLLAESGITVAMNKDVDEMETALLERQLNDQEGWKVTMTGEGGRIHLNWILAGEDPAKLLILDRFLTNLDLTQAERSRIVDCLLDWVDPNDTKRLNGQEKLEGYEPTNRPFRTMEEVAQVAGIELLEAKVPEWRNLFTLYSSGPVDIQWADPSLLAALPGLDPYLAERLIKYRVETRKTPEGDITGFSDMEEVRKVLGWDEKQFNALARLTTVRDAVYRIDSTGIWADREATIHVVARKDSDTPAILEWRQ